MSFVAGQGKTGRKASLPLAELSASGDRGRMRGRGALTNRSGRHESIAREEIDDGWGDPEPLPPFRTQVTVEQPRRVITRNASPDIAFDRSVNPYRGCEHGCVYCFARPTHANMGLSPGLDFETRLFAKADAAELLERELANPRYEPAPIALGTNTDPYQPIERERRITRGLIEVLARARHPFVIVTKSALVVRDIDLIAPMAAQGLAKVAVSVTTLDPLLARTMEPRAPTPARRIEAIGRLAQAGITVTVLMAPLIPGLNDHEMELIMERAHGAGAREAGYVVLRLPLEVRDLFQEWLAEHHPAKLRRVMALVRGMRGGKDYDATWGERQTGTGPYATLTARRFEAASARLGYPARRSKLRTDLFERPVLRGGQLALL